MSSFLLAAIVRQEGATRHRASGWLQLRPSRYSTILPHLSSNNLQDVPPSKLFFSFHSTVPFCSLPTDISCRSGLELSPFWAHIGRLPTRHACRLQERAIFLACLRSRFTTWLWKTESTQRRPKHPDDRRILSQCKSQLVGNAARDCRMTNRPKPSARPKKMRANGAPQSRIPHDKHSCKTQNPGVHKCSLRP